MLKIRFNSTSRLQTTLVFAVLSVGLSGCGGDNLSGAMSRFNLKGSGNLGSTCKASSQTKASELIHQFGPFEQAQTKFIYTGPLKNTATTQTTLGVGFKSVGAVPRGTVLSVAYQNACNPHRRFPKLEIENVDVTVQTDLALEELQAQIDEDPCIISASESHQYTTMAVPNDPQAVMQTHLTAVNALTAFDALLDPLNGLKVDTVIGLVDTGLDINHEDLAGTAWVNKGETAGNNTDDDNNGFTDDINGYNFVDNNNSLTDGQGHGTHVAGLAGALTNNNKGVAGMMPSHSKFLVAKVFGNSGGSSTSVIVNGLRYAALMKSQVINMSLGGCGYDAAYGQALTDAVNGGATVVIAAGNSNLEITGVMSDGNNCGVAGQKVFTSPASFGATIKGVIAVTSTDANRNKARSTFSNYGVTAVKIAAPGSADSTQNLGLLSTVPGNQYDRKSGTSMATPVVAGALAAAHSLIRSRGGVPTPSMLEDILVQSADVAPNLQAEVKDGKYLNFKALIDAVNQRFPATTTQPPASGCP